MKTTPDVRKEVFRMTLGAALKAAGAFVMAADITGLVKIGVLVGSALFTAYVSYKMYQKKKTVKEQAAEEKDPMVQFTEFSIANENVNTVEETIENVRNTMHKADKKKYKKSKKAKRHDDRTEELRLELSKFHDQLNDIEISFNTGRKQKQFDPFDGLVL